MSDTLLSDSPLPADTSETLLRATGIAKSFFGVTVLEGNDGMPDGHYAKFGGENLPGYPEVWQERQIP